MAPSVRTAAKRAIPSAIAEIGTQAAESALMENLLETDPDRRVASAAALHSRRSLNNRICSETASRLPVSAAFLSAASAWSLLPIRSVNTRANSPHPAW